MEKLCKEFKGRAECYMKSSTDLSFKQNPVLLTFVDKNTEREFMKFIFSPDVLPKYSAALVLALSLFFIFIVFDFISGDWRKIFIRSILGTIMYILAVLPSLPRLKEKNPFLFEKALSICSIISLLTITYYTSRSVGKEEPLWRVPFIDAGMNAAIWSFTLPIRMHYAAFVAIFYPIGQGLAVFLNWLEMRDVKLENPNLVQDHITVILFNTVSGIVGLTLAFATQYSLRNNFITKKKIEKENETILKESEKSEAILNNVLPKIYIRPVKEKILEKLNNQTLEISENPQLFSKSYNNAAVLFSDLVSFTDFSSSVSAEYLVNVLNKMFEKFDSICKEVGVEKIKTVGDAYFAVSGLDHCSSIKSNARRCLTLGLRMIQALEELNQFHGWDLKMRVGVGVGQCTLAVFGNENITFDAYGPAVEEAMRMEESSVPGGVKVSSSCKAACSELACIRFEPHTAKERFGFLSSLDLDENSILPLVSTENCQPPTVDMKSEPETISAVKFQRVPLMVMFRKKAIFWKMVKYICSMTWTVETSFLSQVGYLIFHILRVILRQVPLWGQSANGLHATLFYIVIIATVGNVCLYLVLRSRYEKFVSRKLKSGASKVEILSTRKTAQFTMVSLAAHVFNAVMASLVALSICIQPGYAKLDTVPTSKNATLAFLLFPGLPPLINALVALITVIPLLFLEMFLQEDERVTRTFIILAVGFIFLIAIRQLVFNSFLMNSFETDFDLHNRRQQSSRDRIVNDQLLSYTLPFFVIEKLKNFCIDFGDVAQLTLERSFMVDQVDTGVVCFSQFQGFQEAYYSHGHETVLREVHRVFSKFDGLGKNAGFIKIKCIYNTYLTIQKDNEANDGVFNQNQLLKAAEMSLNFIEAFENSKLRSMGIEVRIGLHCGKFVAGIVGSTNWLYDCFGDTVNMTSRLMSTCEGTNIQILRNSKLADSIRTGGSLTDHQMILQERGSVFLKGKGYFETCYLCRK